MICSGEYRAKDRVCYLCSEVNKEAYKQCIKTIFDGDYIGCKLDCCEGDYVNCIPFEYNCIYKEVIK